MIIFLDTKPMLLHSFASLYLYDKITNLSFFINAYC